MTMQQRLDEGQIEVVDPQVADVLRKKTPAERIAMIGEARRTALLLASAGVRYRHPAWDAAQVEAEVLRRFSRAAD